MSGEQKVPDSWVQNLTLVLLAVPLLTAITRWIAQYLRRSRIEEFKEWTRSEDGRDFWKQYQKDLEDDK